MGFYVRKNAGVQQLVKTGQVGNVVLQANEARIAHYFCAPDTVDDNGILQSITPVIGLTDATLDGAGVDVPRTVTITCDGGAVAAGAGTTLVTITGLNAATVEITEVLTAINGETESAKAFASVTGVSIATAELYTISLDTPSSGNFILGNDVDGWTEDIAYNASDGDILAAVKLIYGDANVVAVSSLEVEFLPGVLAAFEFDGTDLVDAGAAAMSTDTSVPIIVGYEGTLGIPALMEHSTVIAVFHNEVLIAEAQWTGAADADDVESNTLDPGATVSSALNGTKVLDIYFMVPSL